MEQTSVVQRVSRERLALAIATTGAPKLLDRVRQTIREALLTFARVGAGVVVGRARAAKAVVAAKRVHDRRDASVLTSAHKGMQSE